MDDRIVYNIWTFTDNRLICIDGPYYNEEVAHKKSNEMESQTGNMHRAIIHGSQDQLRSFVNCYLSAKEGK